MLSLEQEKSSCSVVKENTSDTLSTSCAASPSSPQLEIEPSANQLSSQSGTESQLSGPTLHLQAQNTVNLKKKFTTCGTQWLASETGDALLLQDHNYSCVPPWNPLPLFSKPGSLCTQPFTSTPIKASSSQPPRLLELSINLEEDTDVTIDDDVNDNSLQVSFDDDNINNSSIQVSCDEEAGEDSSFNISFEEVDQDTTQSDLETDPPVSNSHDTIYEKMCSSPKYIVFEEELLKLFGRCVECGGEVLEKELLKKGSALKVTTLCKNSHSKEWVSQPLVNRAAAGNVLLSGAILFTGNTFSRVSEVASAINLAFLSKSDYHNWQKKHLFPVINDRWQQEKAAVLADLLDRNSVTLLGDGRCDSPGYSAKYGTYTMMDKESEKIVDFEVCHVKQSTSSQAMEKRGFKHCLDRALNSGIPVGVVGTDRHTGIKALMRSEYKDLGVEHQVDVWHLTKNIKSKLVTKAKKKECRDLSPWIKSVTNHMWWSAMTCDGNPQLLKEKWVSILHHTADKHDWDSTVLYSRCAHEPISPRAHRKTKWLVAGSPAHEALKHVVLEKTLLKDLDLLTKTIHTGALEVYHSLYNKYAPKRQHFGYLGMVARTQLTNLGTGRSQAEASSGEKRFRYVYPKGMKDWVVRPVFEEKTKPHVTEMLCSVLEMRDTGEEPEQVQVPDLPKNIAPIPRPPKEDLLARHVSRFGKKLSK